MTFPPADRARRRTGRWIPQVQRPGPVFPLAEGFAECAVRTVRTGLAVHASADDLLSDYDVYDQANVAGAAGTTNNPFVLGAPQRGIEFGGYPNDGNFTWSVAHRQRKQRFVQQYAIPRMFTSARRRDSIWSAIRKAVMRSRLPARPALATTLRSASADSSTTARTNQNIGATIPLSRARNFNEPFYRVGGDIRFKYRKLELFGWAWSATTTTTSWSLTPRPARKRLFRRRPSPTPEDSWGQTTGSIHG